MRLLLSLGVLLCTAHLVWVQEPPPPPPPSPTPPPQRPVRGEKPPARDWAGIGNDPRGKRGLLRWLLKGCTRGNLVGCPDYQYRFTEYEGFDGWYNNPAHPELGSVDTALLRRLPANYKDGVYEPIDTRPNPFTLSDMMMAGDIGNRSKTGKTALLVFFGQQAVEEILDAQGAGCPPEYFNIDILEGHRFREDPHHTQMPLLRTRYDMRTGFSPNNPRQQLNEITPWMDGGLMYGTSKAWSDTLRTYRNGTVDKDGLLAYSHGGLFPEQNLVRLPMANPPPPVNHSFFEKVHHIHPVNRFWMLGNPRGNENAFLLTFGVMWFRWHNHIASFLRDEHPDWSGERVFLEARKWVIATQQHITFNTWLPRWIGEYLPDYKGYNPSVDPQIEQMFQSAAMRFGHTLVPPGVYIRKYGREGCKSMPYTIDPGEAPANGHGSAGIRTCNIYWRPQDPLLAKVDGQGEEIVDIDRLLMGMATQIAENEDNVIVEDLRGNVFGPLEFSRRDLMAINIQRARDHGLQDYNTVRESFGLERVNSLIPEDFKRVTGSLVPDEVLRNLSSAYDGKTDNIDLWVGGLLETTYRPGQVFRKIIIDQFQRIRDGDRFWYRNTHNGLFTNEEISRIERLTIYDVIMSVTRMDFNDIQPDPFLAPTNLSDLHDNCQNMDPPLRISQCSQLDFITGNIVGDVSCFHFPQLGSAEAPVENCSPRRTYDYFTGSEIPYILTFFFVGLTLAGTIMLPLVLTTIKKKRKSKEEATMLEKKIKMSFRNLHPDEQVIPYAAKEWVSRKDRYRPVVIIMMKRKRCLEVRSQTGGLLRSIEVLRMTPGESPSEMIMVTDEIHLVLKVPKEYDLVLKFDSSFLREGFVKGLDEFLSGLGTERVAVSQSLKAALASAVVKKHRQKRLERFFRVVFAQAFNIAHNEEEILATDTAESNEVIKTELTKAEFADSLSMPTESIFIQKMFNLVDKDKNGYISFREFLDMLVIFSKGTAEDKAKLMFEMYDINRTGKLTRNELAEMIRSLMESASDTLDQKEVDAVVTSMLSSLGESSSAAYVTLSDFQRLMTRYKDTIGSADLSFTGSNVPHDLQSRQRKEGGRRTFFDRARTTLYEIYETREDLGLGEPKPDAEEQKAVPEPEVQVRVQNKVPSQSKYKFLGDLREYLDNYSLQIFWTILYTLVLLAIFAERAYYYSVEREHGGLRRIAGYGVTVTRGAASAMMFTYSSLLVTMCRNVITHLRETFLNRFIPFDSAVSMHKYIAFWALFFSVIHTIGHAINFYHISTQTATDLTCLFRNFYHASHEIPKFQYWCFNTLTGFTGILLVSVCGLIYAFATQYSRRHLYNWFWVTHNLYPVFYLLMILHGSGRLVQEPFFHYFFLGPCVLFTLDRLVSISRKKVEIQVIKAELLPSRVTLLKFKRPGNFEYKSGQWVRIACLGMSGHEYHPFTLSSAPNEPHLTLHIRAVGPWTSNLRRIYDASVHRDGPLPKIHLDGPYGEGHQDWYKFEVAVLVGGGIGVTPFASILKDIVFRTRNQVSAPFKKVYFLWVTRTQKHFEWLVDIIREVESNDRERIVSVHIFVTQFYHKFDLRTVMLYVCERHFQKVSNRSLFTGLRSVTHFGRPNFDSFLMSLKLIHPGVNRIGVFSCGPPPMTRGVDEACNALNREQGAIFQHHSENF